MRWDNRAVSGGVSLSNQPKYPQDDLYPHHGKSAVDHGILSPSTIASTHLRKVARPSVVTTVAIALGRKRSARQAEEGTVDDGRGESSDNVASSDHGNNATDALESNLSSLGSVNLVVHANRPATLAGSSASELSGVPGVSKTNLSTASKSAVVAKYSDQELDSIIEELRERMVSQQPEGERRKKTKDPSDASPFSSCSLSDDQPVQRKHLKNPLERVASSNASGSLTHTVVKQQSSGRFVGLCLQESSSSLVSSNKSVVVAGKSLLENEEVPEVVITARSCASDCDVCVNDDVQQPQPGDGFQIRSYQIPPSCQTPLHRVSSFNAIRQVASNSNEMPVHSQVTPRAAEAPCAVLGVAKEPRKMSMRRRPNATTLCTGVSPQPTIKRKPLTLDEFFAARQLTEQPPEEEPEFVSPVGPWATDSFPDDLEPESPHQDSSPRSRLLLYSARGDRVATKDSSMQTKPFRCEDSVNGEDGMSCELSLEKRTFSAKCFPSYKVTALSEMLGNNTTTTTTAGYYRKLRPSSSRGCKSRPRPKSARKERKK